MKEEDNVEEVLDEENKEITDEKGPSKRNSVTDVSENVSLTMTKDPNLNKIIVK